MHEYLIVSDTHGCDNRLLSVVYDHPNAKALLFLGDGLSDLACVREVFPNLTCYAVRGNCDWCGTLYHGISCPDEQLLILEGHRLFLTHGHHYGAKFSSARILQKALSLSAEVALFGHSHIPLDVYDRATEDSELCHLFNPGSLGRPYDGKATYGVLQIDGSALLLSHGSY